jgi:hypothetical protein
MAISGVDFDFSGVMELTADMGAAAARVIPNVRKTVEVSARNIKEDWRAEAKKANRGHAKEYPSAINYDMELDTDGSIGAEIGPVLGAQGSLGILEEAPGGVASAPQGNARRALRNNLADFEKGILKATEGVL